MIVNVDTSCRMIFFNLCFKVGGRAPLQDAKLLQMGKEKGKKYFDFLIYS